MKEKKEERGVRRVHSGAVIAGSIRHDVTDDVTSPARDSEINAESALTVNRPFRHYDAILEIAI